MTRLVTRVVAAPPSGTPMAGLGEGLLAVTDDGAGIAPAVVARLAEHSLHARVVEHPPAEARGVLLLGGLGDIGSVAEATAVHRAARRVASAVADRFTASGGVFVTVQDTGGDFGLGGGSPERAWLGGLAALARTAAKEWPAASVKAIDCERGGREAEAVAEAIVAELLSGGRDVDVGLRADGTRLILGTVSRDVAAVPYASADAPDRRVGREAVIVATGGGRGITATALRALAETHRPRLVLLGRTPLTPDGEPEELAGAVDEPELIRRLAERAGTHTGSAAAPAELAAEARRVLAARDIRTTLDALTAAGSPARYLSVDVRDRAALGAALDRVRREWGPITGLVHGAGVLADKLLADKTDEQFERVYGTKVAGLHHLLAATADDPLTTICLFSSVAGCFGNAGQADYAMANDVLDHVASAEQARRPGCLVRALAWGPWRGGMVGPGLAGHLSRAGVPLLPPDAAAAAFTAELTAPTTDARVILTAEGTLEAMAARAAATGGNLSPVG